MKTYFVCSDIHSFYKAWMKSLKEAGFNSKDDEHILIILGDIFDRGEEPWKVYKFIRSLPSERVVLVKGNHEMLLLALVGRKHKCDFDIHNGTYGTLIHLYKFPLEEKHKWIEANLDKGKDVGQLFKESMKIYNKVEAKLYNNKKINEIVEWILSPAWRNYYELGQYIFVHSFIPLLDANDDGVGLYLSYWRDLPDEFWFRAMWGCPYKAYQAGCFKEEEKKGKILVCGHWDTSDFYNNLLYPNEKEKWLDIRTDNPIFKSELFPGLIGLDACTALTNKVNVLVIKESELE